MRPELGHTHPGSTASRPIDIDRAFWLWTASGVLGCVGQVALALRHDPGPLLAVAAAATVVWLLLGLLVRAGRNWARILCALWAVLDVLTAALLLMRWRNPQPLTALALFTSIPLAVIILAAAIAAVAVVFMFRPAATRYATARKRAKR